MSQKCYSRTEYLWLLTDRISLIMLVPVWVVLLTDRPTEYNNRLFHWVSGNTQTDRQTNSTFINIDVLVQQSCVAIAWLSSLHRFHAASLVQNSPLNGFNLKVEYVVSYAIIMQDLLLTEGLLVSLKMPKDYPNPNIMSS